MTTKEEAVDARALDIYRRMALSRHMEQRLVGTYTAGHLPGWVHSCEGHEALGAAIGLTMRPIDHLVPHYRSRPSQLGKGMTPREVLAEVVGSIHSNSGGRGGETHVISLEHRVYGMTGILGANIPTGAGVAYASKMRGLDEVTVCSFGDGTANRGAFHEALNMAAIWELPIVFLCENNVYAELSMTKDFIRVPHIADRAAGYGMPGIVADGGDPESLIEVLAHAIDEARAGRPSLVEVEMVRRRGHWEGDQQKYRDPEEVAALAGNDPVANYRATLLAERGIDEATLAAIEAEVGAEVDEALEWALAGPKPGIDDIRSHVYDEGGRR